VDNLYSNTDFGLCLLQRLSRRLVAARPCRALDPRPRSETPHIVNSSIRFESVIRFSGDPFRAGCCRPTTLRDLRTGILGTGSHDPMKARRHALRRSIQ